MDHEVDFAIKYPNGFYELLGKTTIGSAKYHWFVYTNFEGIIQVYGNGITRSIPVEMLNSIKQFAFLQRTVVISGAISNY
jgi:hypothetical protein